VHLIERRVGYIVVTIPKYKIKIYQEKAKLITGWRLSISDQTLYFPLKELAEVLNIFPEHEIDPKIFDN
jgi:hypothetical protein